MNTATQSKQLQDGTIVRLQGIEFRVSKIKDCGLNGFNENVWKFTGHVVDQSDPLYNTMYNGGRYSYRISDNNIVSQPA